MSAPLCPDCGQPATTEYAGTDGHWVCRNEACAEFGQPIQSNEPITAAPNPGDDDPPGRLP